MLSLCLPQSVCFVVCYYFLCSIQEMNKYYKHKKQEYTAINSQGLNCTYSYVRSIKYIYSILKKNIHVTLQLVSEAFLV